MGLLSQQPFFKKVNSVVNASILIYKINGDARLAPVVFAKALTKLLLIVVGELP